MVALQATFSVAITMPCELAHFSSTAKNLYVVLIVDNFSHLQSVDFAYENV